VDSGYESRLELMEDWYRELVRLDEREQLLLQDYAPHENYLRKLRGSIIDIGGGAGIAARFLHPDVAYVVVDPSPVWDSPEWIEFGRKFRGSGPEPKFVKASGENLPFRDSEFDAAISFWSLNHARDPERCISEMARVLKPGGYARLVIDDIEPGWPELLKDGASRVWARLSRRRSNAMIKTPLIGAFEMKIRGHWTINEDHLPISQRDLERWMNDSVQVERRQWLDGSLTIDLAKP
jgi:ubiquinone/menaquinone biosynthesis C-methylase UbiE